MLISILDSVSCEVSGNEAVAVAPKGLSGDLNLEDFLLGCLGTTDVSPAPRQ